jgi:hypothetical protein
MPFRFPRVDSCGLFRLFFCFSLITIFARGNRGSGLAYRGKWRLSDLEAFFFEVNSHGSVAIASGANIFFSHDSAFK